MKGKFQIQRTAERLTLPKTAKTKTVKEAKAMDERAQIPVSLPRSNPTTAYWQDPPDRIAECRTTTALPPTADIVIIGSGITGAAVAWNLLKNAAVPGSEDYVIGDAVGPRVVMLEARQACSGATGRNGKCSPALCSLLSLARFLDGRLCLCEVAIVKAATRKRLLTGLLLITLSIMGLSRP